MPPVPAGRHVSIFFLPGENEKEIDISEVCCLKTTVDLALFGVSVELR